MKGIRGRRMGLVSAIASCRDCEWWSETLSARALASRHHRRTGHQVSVEQCFATLWQRIDNVQVHKADKEAQDA